MTRLRPFLPMLALLGVACASSTVRSPVAVTDAAGGVATTAERASATAVASAPRGAAAPTAAALEAVPEIPYTRYVLNNGLTLLVHEDRKAPILAVNLWYHVGSKNEPDGRTGFAHLFEHLMFNGSEHYDDDYFQVMERIGATDLNGTTSNDRTNYFQNVPTSALDVALWMESDRMGHLLGAIDQARLDEQRGVVQNEKRQGENQPYGRVFTTILENVYPKWHPYAHSVIGSMEDLNAASLEDVHAWFRSYYGPNNAVLVVAGDIAPEEARARVEHFFGAIPPSPPIEHHDVWVAPMAEDRRQIMQDRVPQARVYRVWNVPEYGARQAAYLSLAADVLSSGKTSRLYRRLVYDDQIATDAGALLWTREIGSNLIVQASAKEGVDLATIEAALDEEIERFLAEGPTADELARAKTASHAGFIRGIERIGGFGGKSDVLAQNEVFAGSPDHYRVYRAWMMDATAEDVRRTAADWMRRGAYTLEVHPFPQLAAASTDADRSALPEAGEPPAPRFPALQRGTLSNGMEIVLAERHDLPIVDVQLIVDAGYAADQHHRPGTANLAVDMMDEGTTTRSALEISDEHARLGARLSTGSDLDASYVTLGALRENLEPSLDLFADVVLNPAFPAEDLELRREQQLAAIRREKASPVTMALRVFPVLLYGEDHPYGIPFTGSGDEAAVRALDADDLRAFHKQWFRPNNATLVVVGDITLAELQPMLEARLARWQPGDVPAKRLDQPPERRGNVVYLMDKPDAPQSVIIAGHAFPPPAGREEFAIQAANRILGGSFTSRINMNLREDKHWSYGSQTILLDARGPRPFVALAPVQSDRTRESMQELMAELQGISGDRPPTEEELVKAKDGQTLTLSGRWETIAAIRGSIAELVNLDLPDDYWQQYADHVRGLRLDHVRKAARSRIQPDALLWVVVGDRATVEPELRQLGFGEIRLISPDGEVLTGVASEQE